MAITRQEAWLERGGEVRLPDFVAEIIEEVAFQARDDSRVDKHSGVSQRLPISLMEAVVSNAERRALELGEDVALVRASDLYAGLSAVTGKLELEYEGELKGGEAVARDIVRRAVGQVFARRAAHIETGEVVEYFDSDNTLRLPDGVGSAGLVQVFETVPGLLDAARDLADSASAEDVGVAAEFVLEGLYARKLVARSEEHGFTAVRPETAEMAQSAPRRRWN